MSKGISGFVIVCAIVPVFFFLCCGGCLFLSMLGNQNTTRHRPQSDSSKGSYVTPDDGKQVGRKKIIDDLIKEGVFEKIGYDGVSLPKVWVTDRFLLLDQKTKHSFLEVVWTYYSIKDDDFGSIGLFGTPLVVKIDDGTINGKRIGNYEPFDGLK